MSGSERTPLSSPPSSGSCFSFSGCLQFFNLTAVSLLAVAVGFLFLQLQVVTYQVAQAQRHIDQVLDKVTNQQQEQIEDLNVKVDQEHDLTVLHMAGTFTLLTCMISMFHMSMHLRNMNEPFVQRKIIAILWMTPIYGITSFLSLLWPMADGYLSIIKDFYEAYVIYQFLSFLIAVLGRGDRDIVVQVLARHDHLDEPTRCLNRIYHPPPSESPSAKANAVLLECQILAMQFVFFRPITSIASFVCTTLMQVDDTGEDAATQSNWAYFASPLFYIAMIQNLSVFFAFSGMLKFYHAVRDDLLWCQPFSKFLVISIIVNLHQGGRWSINDDDDSKQTPREKAAALQNVLICLEMLFFSIAHWCVFPTDEWEPGYRPREYAKPGIGLKDFVSDMSLIMQSSSKASRRSKQSNGDTIDDLALDEEIGDLQGAEVVVKDADVPAVVNGAQIQ